MKGFDLVKLCIKFDFGETNAVAKAVLVALASFYNEDNDGVWPGEKDLLPLASCERRALFRAIKWLEEVELITVERFVGKGNHYRFNEDLLLKGNFQNVTSYQKVTSCQKVTAPVTRTQLHQSPKSNGTSYQKVTQTNKNKKETNKEQIINQGAFSISSCFQTFGQNPVSAPTSWEPDEDDFDTPLRDQIKRNQKIEVDVNDNSRVLTASEIVVLAATLGYRLTHNIALDEIAEKKVITTGIVKEAVQRTRDNTGGVGYLIRILQNAAKDPDAFNGIRKPPMVTAETITEAQCRSFAYKAVNAGCLAYAGESHQEAIARVEKRLKDPTYFNRNRQTLERLGLIQGAQA